MANKPLFSYQQLFKLKRKTIEKRLWEYYETTHDEEKVLKYLVGLQVRDEICREDFSFVMADLVRKILRKTKSTRAVRRYYIYFEGYFEEKEWRTIVVRLYSLKDVVVEKVEKLRSLFKGISLKLLAPS